jgi:hypothetical protein
MELPDKRFVAPRVSGQFKESDDVGRSVKRDRQQKAKRKVKSGQGDRGTDNVFVRLLLKPTRVFGLVLAVNAR